MYQEFKEYTSHFNLDESGIKLKFEHSIRVANISKQIATHLKWNNKDIELATKIGLLHDIGRMQEWEMFKNLLSHLHNFDHGKWGVKVLKKNNYYEKFEVTKEDSQTVFDAVYYHNKYSVPNNKDNKFIKLIRDADKIDILYVLTNVTKLDVHLKGDKISPKVKKDFDNEVAVNSDNVKTYGDIILRTLAFVYDMNYDYSLQLIKDSKAFEKMYDMLENKEVYKEYFDTIYNKIGKRLKQC